MVLDSFYHCWYYYSLVYKCYGRAVAHKSHTNHIDTCKDTGLYFKQPFTFEYWWHHLLAVLFLILCYILGRTLPPRPMGFILCSVLQRLNVERGSGTYY